MSESEASMRVPERVTQLEDLARGVAAAQADAKLAREGLIGTATHPGLRERQTALFTRQTALEQSVESKWESLERWLNKIEHRLTGIEARRVHPFVVLAVVLCAFAIATSAVVVAGVAAYGAIRMHDQDAAAAADMGGSR